MSNGLSDRLNRKVLDNLKILINTDSKKGDTCLSDIQASINSSCHKTLDGTPFFTLHGFDKRYLHDSTQANVPSTTDEFFKDRFSLIERQHGHTLSPERRHIRIHNTETKSLGQKVYKMAISFGKCLH